MKLIRKYRAMILYIIDIMIINISYIISAFLLVNNHIEKLQYVQLLYNTVVLSLFVYLVTFNILDVYRNITRFENGIDYIKYIGLSIFSGAIVILIKFLFKAPLMGYKEIVFATILIAVAIVSYRVIIRFLLNEINPIEKERTERKNLLIIGAGEAANEIIKTVKNTMKGYYNIVGLIDDNPNKMNYAISGIKILGTRDDIAEICKQYKVDVIFFSISNIDNEMELKQNHYDEKFEIVAIVGSVRDKKRLEQVFKKYNPYLVFHAAAHKHVPLMEVSPLEAIKNNVFGTYNVANYADKYSVKRFILISTDKAVNPTNIMGATKRMCEMIIQAFNQKSKTEFAAVRFGNVLGSNGSVLPLFKKQISAGGPVTVTHKEITRFFMTIPEAVSLVLQAMSYAKGGEIFVLDMGEPVKIYDLAVSLIKLSGLEPNVDIPIEITGLRPGEKLYEELLMSEEGLQTTAHNKIFIGKPSDITYEQMLKKLGKLEEIIQNENISVNKIKDTMKQVVPTYKEPEEINLKVEKHEIENKSSLEIIKDTIEKINNTESKNIKATV